MNLTALIIFTSFEAGGPLVGFRLRLLREFNCTAIPIRGEHAYELLGVTPKIAVFVDHRVDHKRCEKVARLDRAQVHIALRVEHARGQHRDAYILSPCPCLAGVAGSCGAERATL